MELKISMSVSLLFVFVSALTCFYSNGYVRTTSLVTAKKICNVGELCMLIHSTSVKDGVQQILMGCASEDICGGTTYAVFGKRSLIQRNLNLQCCSEDNCNSLEGLTEHVTQTSTIPTTLPTTMSTSLPTTHTTQLPTTHPTTLLHTTVGGSKDMCMDGHASTCQSNNANCTTGDHRWHCIDHRCLLW